MKTIIFLLLATFLTSAKAQEKAKDTLFFSYDSQYINTHIEIPNHFYIEDGSGATEGGFYFTGVQEMKNYKTKKREINLKEFIRSSKFYNENRRLKLRDYDLWDYLKNYVIFLVKTENGKKSYLQVEASFEIE
ncbi:hypothetical protein [Flavobacterium tyrosinilyticum]|uniref:hypothetical protein n=1 Tax=Flavobacterium tyrosinilyticum TaxID=1658740 RepID=UPI00202EC55F|nr:hypothetical protein [Flavobacterium tyrosinilyticum]MCM0666596.1 hypothetical protein [Flavobacterium tyrosinilyticum]